MKRFILSLFCLLCMSATAEAVNYKLWIQPEIIPHTVLRDLGQGMVAVPNPEGHLPIPPRVMYKPVNWNPYTPDVTLRTLIYETTEAGDLDADMFAACPEIRSYRERVLRYDAQFAIAKLDGVYQSGEKSTWPQQREEASRYGSDGFQGTPYCDMIAAAAGITRDEYLLSVKARIAPYDSSITTILGTQVALVRDIYAAQTIGELLAIKWPAAEIVGMTWTLKQ